MLEIRPRDKQRRSAPMDFSNATILCLGDLMLDRFAYCDTERISPEAPVPVLLLQRTQSMLGGAGNVARNVVALGGRAVLLGLVGRDAAGDEIRALIGETAGPVDRNVASASRPTVRKTRYLAAHQPILRAAEEGTHARDAAAHPPPTLPPPPPIPPPPPRRP